MLSYIGLIIVCWWVADFLTGFFHWLEDCYGLPTWPIIGESVILPNIDHHRNPSLIGKMGTWVSRNIQPVIIAIVGSIILWFCGLNIYIVLLIAMFAAMGNQVHCWSHRSKKDNPKFVTWLQSAGIIQSPIQHNKHHVPPYTKYYCTLGNFVNEVLELIRFWPTLEYVISLCGIKPKRLTPERDFY